MTFITYAQNFEDVMLWRALRHVECGAYVDVGAYDPVVDSVSKAFYGLGWRGIHVEPVREYAERLRADRPDEVVIEAALSNETGMLALFKVLDTGMSTCIPEIAENCRALGYSVEETQVSCLRLEEVLAQVPGDAIHWLKIDVEGAEERVLSGWSGTRRPWIVVVEAMKPLSQVETHQGWEPLLLGKGYQMAFADGLNRYYIAPEHLDLHSAFRYGVNVLDGFEAGDSCWISRAVVRGHQSRLAELTALHSAQLEAMAGRLAKQESAIAGILDLADIGKIAERLTMLRTEAAAALARDVEQADRISSKIDGFERRPGLHRLVSTRAIGPVARWAGLGESHYRALEGLRPIAERAHAIVAESRERLGKIGALCDELAERATQLGNAARDSQVGRSAQPDSGATSTSASEG